MKIPTALPGVEATILDPGKAWADKDTYQKTLRKLADSFKENFAKFATNPEGQALVAVGPQ